LVEWQYQGRPFPENAMFKDLVVPLTSTSGDTTALDFAIARAASHGAHLTVIETLNLPSAGPWVLGQDDSLAGIYRTLRSQAGQLAASLRLQLDKHPISSEVRIVETLVESPRMASHLAHYADLAIVAGTSGDTPESERTRAFFGNLLLESGRPVIVVPPASKASVPPRHVVMAWRPTHEASRAVHDALPLLIGAETVDLLLVDTNADEQDRASQPGAAIASHLARHGVDANVVVKKSRSGKVGAALIDHVNQSGADLLVVGGYGHSRFREWALGGVTRKLLLSAQIPVLYSH
jgi:nucleotide-binding universal stress UspA family protein